MTNNGLRQATAADAEALAGLHGAAGTDRCWSAAEYAALLARPDIVCPLMERDGEVTGYAMAALTADEAEIYVITVAPRWRRQGIARCLLREIIVALKEVEIKYLHLEVAEDNQAALTLYQDLGFQIGGRRKQYYKYSNERIVDAIVMVLEI